MKAVLFCKDNKNKIRQINISCVLEGNIYKLKRNSGIYKGKFIEQPEIIIDKGKVKRTLEEQALLVYNSNLKKYLDKGYKDLTEFYNNDDFDPNNYITTGKSDAKNVGKPMLCKVMDLNNKKQTEQNWYASRKLDGTRALLYFENGEVKTSSRGGQDYNIPSTYICNDPYIISLFKNNKGLILDGEIYRHGWPLNKISGLCRLESLTEEHKELNFNCYDIADENKTFKERLEILNKIKENCPKDSHLIIVEHYPITGKDMIMKYHNHFVSEGYEGLVVRNPNEKYKFGARDQRMMKVKLFSDMEAKITGISEGLRDEDMCFTMETQEGYSFKAKPIGTREDKAWYRKHINELIGKMGTIKYFGMTHTEHPVPNLPIFKAVRLEKDM